MKESIFYVCFITITIVLCALWFCFNTRFDYRKTVKLEREWGAYVYAMNILPYDEMSGRIAEVQRNISMPIIGFEFDGTKPVKAYLINGEVKDINWVN